MILQSPSGLPSNAPIANAGPVSTEFQRLRVPDFQAACAWLQALPYGKNSRSDDLMVLFKDGCGTCTTKHGVAAALAEELGLPVRKHIVFYKLDPSVRRGIDPILEKRNVAFVPTTHCILGEGIHFVDLTHGNLTGKLKDLTEFELYVAVRPDFTAAELAELYEWGLAWYRRNFPALGQLSADQIRALRRECLDPRVRCAC